MWPISQDSKQSMTTMAAAAAADHPKQLHIVMFPWLGFGHIINFLQLSKFIAQKGHKVSFVSTPRNIDRLPKLNLSTLLESRITFVKLTLPKVDGLPENAEATTDLARDEIPYLTKAIDGLEPEMTRFLEAESPDWIIYDFTPYWLPPIAAKLGISRGFFATVNAWCMPFWASSAEAMINGSDPRTKLEDWMVPPPWIPFPSKVALKPYELGMIAKARGMKSPSGVSLGFRTGSVISGSDAIFVRHCMEFEPEWISLCERLYGKPIIPVGLLPPSAQDSRDDVNDDPAWLTIKEWLDVQQKGSVVYVAMGSEAPQSQDQLTELALGLELAGLPFFWALKKSGSAELPDGYLENNKGRGMVSTSWAPQLKILSHNSVGGFLTHCGWGSLVEGMMFGKPLIMLPLHSDQGLNARVIEDRQLGIEVARNDADGSFTRNSVANSLSLVMVGDEGKIFKEKAKEISSIIADMELHDKYIANFVKYLERQRETLPKMVLENR